MATYSKPALPKVEVIGAEGLQKVFAQLPIQLEKKYLAQLLTKTTAAVRKDARKLAPDGKKSGSTEQKSTKSAGEHRSLRKNIRAGKTKRRPKGTMAKSVYGPPHSVPLLTGHRGVAWGRATGRRVQPARPFMEEARKKHRNTIRNFGTRMVKQFIRTDAANLGKKQAQGVLSKSGLTRLEALRASGIV